MCKFPLIRKLVFLTSLHAVLPTHHVRALRHSPEWNSSWFFLVVWYQYPQATETACGSTSEMPPIMPLHTCFQHHYTATSIVCSVQGIPSSLSRVPRGRMGPALKNPFLSRSLSKLSLCIMSHQSDAQRAGRTIIIAMLPISYRQDSKQPFSLPLGPSTSFSTCPLHTSAGSSQYFLKPLPPSLLSAALCSAFPI